MTTTDIRQPSLPLIRPALHGWAEGVVCAAPFTLQCRECGHEADAATVGLPSQLNGGSQEVAAVILLSHIEFHPRAWTSGHADNPRLCRPCRLARGCTCDACQWERRG